MKLHQGFQEALLQVPSCPQLSAAPCTQDIFHLSFPSQPRHPTQASSCARAPPSRSKPNPTSKTHPPGMGQGAAPPGFFSFIPLSSSFNVTLT